MTRARLLALIVLFLFFVPALVLPASALSFDEILPDLLDALPDGVRGEMSDYADPDGVRELLGIERLGSLLLTAIEGGLDASLALFGRLLAAVLFSIVLSLFSEHFDAKAAAAADCAIAAVLAVTVFSVVRADVSLVQATLSDMRHLSDGLIPLFATLFASGGSAGTGVAAASGFAAFSYLLTHVLGAVLSPLLYFLVGLLGVSVLGSDKASDGLFRTLKGLYLTTVIFLSAMLVTSLGFQSTLSASADSLAAGSIRFAVGNLIPIVGGTLGGSLRTLASSLALIRSTLGTLSLGALLLSVLPVLVSVLLHRLFLSLAADLSDMLGSSRASRILVGFRGIYDIAAATLSVALVLFFFILGILCRTVTAIG